MGSRKTRDGSSRGSARSTPGSAHGPGQGPGGTGEVRPRADRDPARRRLLLIGLAAALAVATLAVYAQVAGFEFLAYDDRPYVLETPEVRSGLSWPGVIWALRAFHLANWHPLTWMSHMLDVTLYGLSPGGHHVTSLLLHAASSCLLFLYLTWTTERPLPSALAAGLFALHPLHVESVAWIAERKDVLSVFFAIATMIAYARYTRAPAAGPYVAALGLYALGLLSKPMLVTLPFALLLLDYWPLSRERGSDRARSRESDVSGSPGRRPASPDESERSADAAHDPRAHVARLPGLVAEKIPSSFCRPSSA